TEMTEAFPGEGLMVDSPPFYGTPAPAAIPQVIAWLAERGIGRAKVQYRLRDWLISRQRYWGCPIPSIHCPSCGIVPVPEDQLPVMLPEHVESFIPTGRSPLEDVREFIETTCPQGGGRDRPAPATQHAALLAGGPRSRHHGHLRRLVLVPPALRRSH